jgi:hypothetical protein
LGKAAATLGLEVNGVDTAAPKCSQFIRFVVRAKYPP